MIAVPIKPFGVAKRRLASVLSATERSRLGRRIASNTLAAAASTGGRVAVVTNDDGVASWSSALSCEVIPEPGHEPGGLDGAARAAVAAARAAAMPWAIVHADLPLITPADLEAVGAALPQGGVVLVPSRDGGTNVLAGDLDEFPFSYGPGSFHRHLAAAAELPVRIVVRPNLALDLDDPEDLAEIRALELG